MNYCKAQLDTLHMSRQAAAGMRIRTIRHKGLKKLFETDSGVGLPANAVPKLRIMLAFLQAMGTEDELSGLPVWKPHKLSGDRKGAWSLHVTKNWRLTFHIEGDPLEIHELDFEDYH